MGTKRPMLYFQEPLEMIAFFKNFFSSTQFCIGQHAYLIFSIYPHLKKKKKNHSNASLRKKKKKLQHLNLLHKKINNPLHNSLSNDLE